MYLLVTYLQCLATILPIAGSLGSHFTSSTGLFSLLFFVTFLDVSHKELVAFKDARKEKNPVSEKADPKNVTIIQEKDFGEGSAIWAMK